jgi:hypothetical protein
MLLLLLLLLLLPLPWGLGCPWEVAQVVCGARRASLGCGPQAAAPAWVWMGVGEQGEMLAAAVGGARAATRGQRVVEVVEEVVAVAAVAAVAVAVPGCCCCCYCCYC